MLKVGLIQMRTPAAQAAALAQAEPLVREAAAKGATLIATPEGTNILQRNRAALFEQIASAEDDVAVIGLRRLADELGVWLLIGSALVRREDGQCANRAILVRPDGGVAATYDKLHMFDVDLPAFASPPATPRGTGRSWPRPPAPSSGSPSVTTCASRRCTTRWRRLAPRC
jgi:predicted amidohydrolase